MEDRLKTFREAIDRIDKELLQLLNRRMEFAREVGRTKAELGLLRFDPAREEAILERLARTNTGPLQDHSLWSIYREIFSASRLLQYDLQITFLGPEWTYSHLAALSIFGHSARYLPAPTLEDVFDNLLKKQADLAVVPIENALQGGIGRTLDLLYERDVKVIQESYLEVAHYLCSTGESLAGLKDLYGQPQALEQCRRWLLDNLRHVEWHECSSTAQAAQLARQEPSRAAVCNPFAAFHYGLRILAERIEDHPENVTRFFTLASHLNPPTGDDKTSVLFAVPDQPGALHAALEGFALFKVNMSRIESRPNRLFPWQYLFFADVEGHAEQAPTRQALEYLQSRTTFLKVLGSYPRKNPKHPASINREQMISLLAQASGGSPSTHE